MYNLYFLNFNNKFNRTVKRFDVLNDYEPYIVGTTQMENFKWADEITTEVIANIEEVPNYCLVCDAANDVIIARFFVVEEYWVRQGQYKLSLERDTMADYYYDILEMPMFIEKATITDLNDPSIYIRDGQFNQIKKREVLLQDPAAFACPWVVGYINRDTTAETITTTFPDAVEPTYEVNGIANWEHYNKTYTWSMKTTTWFNMYFAPPTFATPPVFAAPFSYAFNKETVARKSGEITDIQEAPNTGYVYEYHGEPNFPQKILKLLSRIRSSNEYFLILDAFAKSKVNETIDESTLNNINGAIVKDTATNTYYRVVLDYTSGGTYNTYKPSVILTNFLNSNLVEPEAPEKLWGEADDNTWEIAITTNIASIKLEQIFTAINVPITNDRNHLEDAPYDMFCIPAGNIEVRYGTIEEKFTTKSQVAISAGSALAEKLGGNCFDVQLLPYFPCREILRSTDSSLRVYRTRFSLITDSNDENVSVIVWARRAQFNFDILNSPAKRLAPTNALQKKILHETELYRICSPNYSAAFDFNPAANNGVLTYQVSCHYKPFQPYIHINPVFNDDGLYGGNYNDARGLICAGDFSLSQMSDAWVNYELNNKNFQQMFDRQIQSLELQQAIGFTQDIVKTITGTIQGAASGGMTGGMIGGGAGAAIGGAAGGIASLIGGGVDIAMNQRLRADQIGLASTQHRLSIENIKAQPDTITKISSLNQQNKIFPFIEIYDATDEEKEYFKSQLKYSGMSINRIGTLTEFLGALDEDNREEYVQGQVIKVPYTLSKHTADVIVNTLANGVYLTY